MKRQYDIEFKLDAAKLVADQGYSVPDAGERLLCEEPEVRFGFIADHRLLYPVVLLCRVMDVSRSGFYDYLARAGREPARREREDTALLKQITAIFEESRKRYGSPRIHAELRERQVVCSLKRVKRLMRQLKCHDHLCSFRTEEL